MTRNEFVQRFVDHCVQSCGFTNFDDGESVADYALSVAGSYWDDEDRRADGPEDCADEDISYWGES